MIAIMPMRTKDEEEISNLMTNKAQAASGLWGG
jgi:hypothetical protein